MPKCDEDANRGDERGRGEERGGGRRGAARHGNRRRDSPGPLKSETAQSSCPRPSPPRPLAQAATLGLLAPSSTSASTCAATPGARLLSLSLSLSLTPRSFEKPIAPLPSARALRGRSRTVWYTPAKAPRSSYSLSSSLFLFHFQGGDRPKPRAKGRGERGFARRR